MNTLSSFDSVPSFLVWWSLEWTSLVVLTGLVRRFVHSRNRSGSPVVRACIAVAGVWSACIVFFGMNLIAVSVGSAFVLLFGAGGLIGPAVQWCAVAAAALAIAVRIFFRRAFGLKKAFFCAAAGVAFYLSFLHGLVGLLNPFTDDNGNLSASLLHRLAPESVLAAELREAVFWRKRGGERIEEWTGTRSRIPCEYDAGIAWLAVLSSDRCDPESLRRLEREIGENILLSIPENTDGGRFEKVWLNSLLHGDRPDRAGMHGVPHRASSRDFWNIISQASTTQSCRGNDSR